MDNAFQLWKYSASFLVYFKFCFDYRLFGPRKKMTNAIARWQSKAPMPTDNKLEQAYADRLEGEMQEMALQLLKVSDALGCP